MDRQALCERRGSSTEEFRRERKERVYAISPIIMDLHTSKPMDLKRFLIGVLLFFFFFEQFVLHLGVEGVSLMAKRRSSADTHTIQTNFLS